MPLPLSAIRCRRTPIERNARERSSAAAHVYVLPPGMRLTTAHFSLCSSPLHIGIGVLLVPCALSALALRIRCRDCCLACLPTLLFGRSARRLAVCVVVSLWASGCTRSGVSSGALCTRGVLRAILDCEPARGVESYVAPRRGDSPYTKKDSRAHAAPLILRRGARVRSATWQSRTVPTVCLPDLAHLACSLPAQFAQRAPPFMLSFGSERHGISPNGEKPRVPLIRLA